jgi:hypothetical protein
MEDLEVSFDEHPRFNKKFSKFCKRYPQAEDGFRHLKKLLSTHFHPQNQNPILTPTVLNQMDGIGPNVRAFKITMNTKGLSQGQAPRLCFWLRGNLITFLCFGSHIDNYKHSVLIQEVRRCIKELDPDAQLSR